MLEENRDPLPFLPSVPVLPDPAPPVVEVVYSYEQLKKYRLASAPLIGGLFQLAYSVFYCVDMLIVV